MNKNTKEQPTIRNQKLKPFSVLVGVWNTVGTHPYFPETILHGCTSFEWLEDGAFLIVHSQIYETETGVPTGVAIFGSDDTTGEYFMLYFDERGVSRKYDVKLQGNVWQWWRNAPGFSQRFTNTIADDGNTIIGKGEMSKDGSTWEKDLELTYTRVK